MSDTVGYVVGGGVLGLAALAFGFSKLTAAEKDASDARQKAAEAREEALRVNAEAAATRERALMEALAKANTSPAASQVHTATPAQPAPQTQSSGGGFFGTAGSIINVLDKTGILGHLGSIFG